MSNVYPFESGAEHPLGGVSQLQHKSFPRERRLLGAGLFDIDQMPDLKHQRSPDLQS